MRLIHCADFHLGSPLTALGDKADERHRELMLSFERVCRLSNEKSADFLLICGDLFDSVSVSQTIISDVFSALAAVRAQVVIIPGNHDYYAPGTPLAAADIPENVHIFTERSEWMDFPQQKTRIWGSGFGGSHKSESALAGFEAPDSSEISVAMLHGDLGASSDYAAFSEEELAASALDYAALGHIHRRREIASAGRTRYAYCGCPEGRGFDETGKCGVYCIDITKFSFFSEFIPISSREFRVIEVDISQARNDSDAAKICSQAVETQGGDYRRHYYKLVLCGRLSPDIHIDEAAVALRLSESLYYVKCENCVSVAYDIDALSQETTLRGIFARRVAEMLAAADENDRKAIMRAAELGLQAFESDITLRKG